MNGLVDPTKLAPISRAEFEAQIGRKLPPNARGRDYNIRNYNERELAERFKHTIMQVIMSAFQKGEAPKQLNTAEEVLSLDANGDLQFWLTVTVNQAAANQMGALNFPFNKDEDQGACKGVTMLMTHEWAKLNAERAAGGKPKLTMPTLNFNALPRKQKPQQPGAAAAQAGDAAKAATGASPPPSVTKV